MLRWSVKPVVLKGGRVPAYLVVPEGKGQFAAVEFVHWGQGDRTEFLNEAFLYAKGGAISLLIDAPFNRPDWPSRIASPVTAVLEKV